MDLSVLLGGPQGSGVQSASDVLARALKRAGWWVFVEQSYFSNIQGRHSFVRVRIADHPVRSSLTRAVLVLALDRESLVGDADPARDRDADHHGHVHQAPDGVVVVDRALGVGWLQHLYRPIGLDAPVFCPVDLDGIAGRAAGDDPKRVALLRNAALLGAGAALLRFDVERLADALASSFGTGPLAAANAAAARAAHAEVTAGQLRTGKSWSRLPSLSEAPGDPGRILIRGTQASALGKLAAGCGFQAYYPIAPASEESTFLERSAPDQGTVVVQTEDEAAAAVMVVGAAYAGVRASTATSGPGFALMTEAIGLAAVAEIGGVVISHYQRSGPSTGMPTRTEQADLLWAIHPAHGEFPHIVVAPGSAAELYRITALAFDWAERYACPVVVLSDKQQASSAVTLDALPELGGPPDRGSIIREIPDDATFERYAGDAGASPRTLPGTPAGIHWTTSDEHDRQGHVSESVAMRTLQMRKRMASLEAALRDIPADVALSTYGPRSAEHTVVCWGSPAGALLDVLERRVRDGRAPFRLIQIRLLHPFPAAALERALEASPAYEVVDDFLRWTVVEENHTGQLAELIRARTGRSATAHVRKSDGRAFSVEELDDALEVAFIGAEGADRVIRVVSDE